MSYTAPAGNAVNFSWSGKAAYTPPAGNAVDFTFAPPNIYSATGFTSSSFGAPTSSRAQRAVGFASTAFGAPALNLNSTRIVTGLAPGSAFGAPVALYSQISGASGFVAVALGAPASRRTQSSTGFSATQFGAAAGLKTQRPAGFTSTQFGSARLFPLHAVGFKPTTFGQARLFPFHVAPGLRSTQFGTPAGTQHWGMAAWPPVARFGTPTTPTNRTLAAVGVGSSRTGTPFSLRFLPPSRAQAGAASGSVTGRFGAPRAAYFWQSTASGFTVGDFGQAWARAPAASWASAHGSFVSRFGTPLAGWLRTYAGSGFRPGMFGTPNGTAVQLVAGFTSGAMGAPAATLTAHALGFRPGMFGTPTATRGQRAAGFGSALRFGLPTPLRSNTYPHYGFTSSRFGQPSATCRHNRPATGFRPTAFGTPACYERHRVTHLAPGTQFGRALLKRTTQC